MMNHMVRSLDMPERVPMQYSVILEMASASG